MATLTRSTVSHSTFTIERSYPSSTPERVFQAFADPVRKRRWFARNGDTSFEHHELDFRPGGRERTTSRLGDRTPFPGVALTNDTTYLDIADGRRIVFAYSMTVGERRISASLATVELVPDGAGTRLLFTDQGAYFEGSDGPEVRSAGWTEILSRLDAEMA